VTVVDASVVLEWLIGRPPAASRALLDAHVAGAAPLVAPDLLHYEIGDVLVTRIALPVLELMQLFTHWLELDVETYALGDEEHRTALDLAKRHGLTFYDAAYLALADGLDCTLATADRKLARAAASIGRLHG
jgi:predicted nucleic acid-binding protein